ncbi:hypothetical protein, partial [Paraburkholderia sp. EG304]
ARNQRDRTPNAPASKSPSRGPLPPHLPREEIVLEPDPLCPTCVSSSAI